MKKSFSSLVADLTEEVSAATIEAEYLDIKNRIESLLEKRPMSFEDANQLEKIYQAVLERLLPSTLAIREKKQKVYPMITLPQKALFLDNYDKMSKIMIKNKIYNTVEMMSLDFLVIEE